MNGSEFLNTILSSFDEEDSNIFKCEICGREFDEDELTCGVCDDCISEVDFEGCLEINGDEKEDIAINSLVVSLLDESDINTILINYLREANQIEPIDCFNYTNGDKEWFAERLKEVRR